MCVVVLVKSFACMQNGFVYFSLISWSFEILFIHNDICNPNCPCTFVVYWSHDQHHMTCLLLFIVFEYTNLNVCITKLKPTIIINTLAYIKQCPWSSLFFQHILLGYQNFWNESLPYYYKCDLLVKCLMWQVIIVCM